MVRPYLWFARSWLFLSEDRRESSTGVLREQGMCCPCPSLRPPLYIGTFTDRLCVNSRHRRLPQQMLCKQGRPSYALATCRWARSSWRRFSQSACKCIVPPWVRSKRRYGCSCCPFATRIVETRPRLQQVLPRPDARCLRCTTSFGPFAFLCVFEIRFTAWARRY